MSTVVMAWPLKRSVLARLDAIAQGVLPAPPGTEALVGAEVTSALPADPDRVCVFAGPVLATRSATTGEFVTTIEIVSVELRVRVFQPGTDDTDLTDIDKTLGDVCQAVAVALLDYEPIVSRTGGSMQLVQITQQPIAVSPTPEPYAIATAAIAFRAEVATT